MALLERQWNKTTDTLQRTRGSSCDKDRQGERASTAAVRRTTDGGWDGMRGRDGGHDNEPTNERTNKGTHLDYCLRVSSSSWCIWSELHDAANCQLMLIQASSSALMVQVPIRSMHMTRHKIQGDTHALFVPLIWRQGHPSTDSSIVNQSTRLPHNAECTISNWSIGCKFLWWNSWRLTKWLSCC